VPFEPGEGEETLLHGIDPALNADVLYVLRAMGHGDDIVVCDANFPAEAAGVSSCPLVEV